MSDAPTPRASATRRDDPGPRHYLTGDLPGVGGRLKERPDDFLVDENPLFQPDGQGEHLYLLVEKRGLSSTQMIDVLCDHFNVNRSEVGYAGMKDKQAVTRQVISVHTPGRTPEDFPELRHENVSILWADLHATKLRVGQLRGNRFSIRIRGVPITAVRTAQEGLARLERTGAANYFGPQRFGAAGNNHIIGSHVLRGDFQSAIDELLSADEKHEHLADFEARRLAQAGDYAGAMRIMPRGSETEARAIRALSKGWSLDRVIDSLGRTQRRFFLSAFQSHVFNRVLDERVRAGALDRFFDGDVAWRHEDGSVFAIDARGAIDEGVQGALERKEICPSGPLWGPKMTRASGATDAMEREALAETGVSEDMIRKFDRDTGVRRPLRVPVIDPEVEAGVDEHGSYVRCAFELPSGAYATVVLDEIMKTEAPASRTWGAGAGRPT